MYKAEYIAKPAGTCPGQSARRREKREHSAGAGGLSEGHSFQNNDKQEPEFAGAPAIGGGAMTRRQVLYPGSSFEGRAKHSVLLYCCA